MSAAVLQGTNDNYGIDLFVTLPEDPTASLTRAVQADPYFTCVSVASRLSSAR